MSWLPPDDVYSGYSLYSTFGYGPEGEKNLTRNLLREHGFVTDDKTVKLTINYISKLHIFLKKKSTKEIVAFKKISQEKSYAGGTLPFDIEYTKLLVVAILVLIGQGFFTQLGSDLYTLIKNSILSLNNKSTPPYFDESEIHIFIKSFSKISKDEEILDQTETFIRKISYYRTLGKNIKKFNQR